MGGAAQTSAAEVCIEGRDTGIGISQVEQERIFQRFIQLVSSPRSKRDGVGLGLSITNALVELMGGTMSVESLPDRGSSFSVSLRFDEVEHQAPRDQYITKLVDGVCVLLVDEHPTRRRFTRLMLEPFGIRVTETGDGLEAMMTLSTAPEGFDAFMVDHAVRHPDARTLLQEVRGNAQTQKTRTMLLGPLSGISVGVPEEFMDARVPRPLRRDALLTALLTVLERDSSELDEITAFGDRFGVDTPMRILLVEDHTDSRLAVLGILSQAGHFVELAMNGVEAVKRAREGHWDLVLMDIDMPVMDGLEATCRIRAHEDQHKQGATPIVALTAHAMASIRQTCLDVGMDGFLSKPITRFSMLEAVAAWGDVRPRILIVDDMASSRLLLGHFLKSISSWRTLEAEDGEQALHLVARLPIVLVLLDLEMPVMDGLTTARAIRALPHGQQIRIIAVTGHTSAAAQRSCFEAGCNGYLPKPVRRGSLLAAVRQQMEQWSSQSITRRDVAPADVDPDVIELLPSYLEDLRSDLRSLNWHLVGGDFEAMRRIGHNLKGSGSTYGLDRISELGALLEDAAKAREAAFIEDLMAQLARYMDELGGVVASRDSAAPAQDMSQEAPQ